jgi:hypothetical protein
MGEQHWNWQYGKLAKAVDILVTNHNDVRERVWVASEYLFMLHPAMVPPSCKEDVEWIQKMLTRYPASGYYRSAVEATYHRTRNVTAGKIARRVWKLFHQFQTEREVRDDQRRQRLTAASTRTRAKAARAGNAGRYAPFDVPEGDPTNRPDPEQRRRARLSARHDLDWLRLVPQNGNDDRTAEEMVASIRSGTGHHRSGRNGLATLWIS